ncbi:MAG TPA: VOC family protein [Bacteroidota bacterium]
MNSFGHIELPTTDFRKAKNFYGKLFGWEFQDMPEIDYVLFRTGRHPNGGLVRVKKMPRSAQVNAYIEVEDIETKLKEIRRARGKILVKKSPIGSTGFWAQFETPDGCKLCLYEAAPHEDTAMETPTEMPASQM